MTSREQRARDLLDAAASSRQVDTENLWRGVQSGVEAAADGDGRRSTRHRGAVLAAAAAAAVAGVAIWAAGLEPSTSPPASTQAVTATQSPSPTGTATPSTTGDTSLPTGATTPPVTAGPALSAASLLSTADFRQAGWVVDAVRTSEGWGQSPISPCQDLPGEGRPGTAVYRGDGYAVVGGRSLGTYQYVLDVGTPAPAEALVSRVLHWPDSCASLGRGGVDEGVIRSTPARSVTLPDGTPGYWYTTTFEQGGTTRAELVAVARRAGRVSIVVLQEPRAPGALDAVDAAALVTRAFERIG